MKNGLDFKKGVRVQHITREGEGEGEGGGEAEAKSGSVWKLWGTSGKAAYHDTPEAEVG